MVVQPVVTTAQKRRHNTIKPNFEPREEIADLKSEVEYLRHQVHGLRSQLHGELAVLALRIEDNDRREMLRRKVVRRWLMAAVFAVSAGPALAVEAKAIDRAIDRGAAALRKMQQPGGS